jgi:hypothetical protein
MEKPKLFILLLIFILCRPYPSLNAQVKITDGGDLTLGVNSLLELESVNKGLLIPRVALPGPSLPDPLIASVPAGMIVFSSGGVVTDGFYYWDSDNRIRIFSTGINNDEAISYFKTSTIDQYGGSYITYLDGISSDGLATAIIPSMQGFFVHVTDGIWPVEGSLALNNQVRIINLTHPFVKSGSKGDIPLVRFEAGYSDNAASFDPTVIYLDPNATCNFDGKYDAYKILGNNIYMTNFYTFGCDSSKQSINCLPSVGVDPCRVRLGLKTERDADIIFRIRDLVDGFLYRHISILDLATGVTQDLLNGHDYRINLKTGHYQDRFYLILSNVINTTVDMIPAEDGIKVYSSRGILKVEINLPIAGPGILTIYNLLGKLFSNTRFQVPDIMNLILQ